MNLSLFFYEKVKKKKEPGPNQTCTGPFHMIKPTLSRVCIVIGSFKSSYFAFQENQM